MIINKGLTWWTFAIELISGPLDALAAIVTAYFFRRVADGNVDLTVVTSEARDAGAEVAIGHVDAGAIVLARIRLTLIKVGLAIVT